MLRLMLISAAVVLRFDRVCEGPEKIIGSFVQSIWQQVTSAHVSLDFKMPRLMLTSAAIVLRFDRVCRGSEQIIGFLQSIWQ